MIEVTISIIKFSSITLYPTKKKKKTKITLNLIQFENFEI
jgi:hypothetical protein